MSCAKIFRENAMGKKLLKLLLITPASVLLVACNSGVDRRSDPHPGILWVRDAAEFDAISMQAYRAASDDLPGFVADQSWTAMPGQEDYEQLPPAIILDVDETLVSNVGFQETLEPPFRNSKLNDWNVENTATPIPGAVDFVRLARDHGVELFFVTNRPCESRHGVVDPCPQEAVTVQDLNESGIAADSEHVMLANEMQHWDREKVIRRNLISQDYRVIMLIGDDLSDFIPCVRKKIHAPCADSATIASRQTRMEHYRNYWGAGWYVLPNPMHGSWTTVE
jgi:acid phosphatase